MNNFITILWIIGGSLIGSLLAQTVKGSELELNSPPTVEVFISAAKLRTYLNNASALETTTNEYYGVELLADIKKGHGYVLGTIDSFNVVAQKVGIQGLCIDDGVDSNQLVYVVRKYLNDHPQSWNRPAALMVLSAVGDVWGCGESR